MKRILLLSSLQSLKLEIHNNKLKTIYHQPQLQWSHLYQSPSFFQLWIKSLHSQSHHLPLRPPPNLLLLLHPFQWLVISFLVSLAVEGKQVPKSRKLSFLIFPLIIKMLVGLKWDCMVMSYQRRWKISNSYVLWVKLVDIRGVFFTGEKLIEWLNDWLNGWMIGKVEIGTELERKEKIHDNVWCELHYELWCSKIRMVLFCCIFFNFKQSHSRIHVSR